MSGENRTPTRQFVEIGDARHSGESVSDGEENLRAELLNRRMTSCEIDRRMNTFVTPLSTQLEALIQSVRELNEESSTHLSTGNLVGE